MRRRRAGAQDDSEQAPTLGSPDNLTQETSSCDTLQFFAATTLAVAGLAVAGCGSSGGSSRVKPNRAAIPRRARPRRPKARRPPAATGARDRDHDRTHAARHDPRGGPEAPDGVPVRGRHRLDLDLLGRVRAGVAAGDDDRRPEGRRRSGGRRPRHDHPLGRDQTGHLQGAPAVLVCERLAGGRNHRAGRPELRGRLVGAVAERQRDHRAPESGGGSADDAELAKRIGKDRARSGVPGFEGAPARAQHLR